MSTHVARLALVAQSVAKFRMDTLNSCKLNFIVRIELTSTQYFCAVCKASQHRTESWLAICSAQINNSIDKQWHTLFVLK